MQSELILFLMKYLKYDASRPGSVIESSLHINVSLSIISSSKGESWIILFCNLFVNSSGGVSRSYPKYLPTLMTGI